MKLKHSLTMEHPAKRMLFTEKEMASMLGISWRMLHELRLKRVVPCIKFSRAVRYEPERVINAIRDLEIAEVR